MPRPATTIRQSDQNEGLIRDSPDKSRTEVLGQRRQKQATEQSDSIKAANLKRISKLEQSAERLLVSFSGFDYLSKDTVLERLTATRVALDRLISEVKPKEIA